MSLTNEERVTLMNTIALAEAGHVSAHFATYATLVTLTGCKNRCCVDAVPLIAQARAILGIDSTYRCEHCGGLSCKRLWGPGWITCPECGTQVRTVHERAGDALSMSGD